ncbi:MAG: GTPase [Candidatus Eisenbacteria bacterium RBG_16_71_46]|nr:MAG: GTPase [Candidatus Eisenbacteria bacterium RBG_16_71_46]
MATARPTRVLIMGAAGRDFHNFNVFWKRQPDVEVVCFTAAQIPDIDGRVYPAVLAGPRYPRGIPIHSEDRLESLIRDLEVDQVTFAYSDVSYDYVMHQASRVHAAGAEFRLLGPGQTMLRSSRPVIAVGAVRTGCGKSQTARRISQILKRLGRRVAVVRHPMPYGDLSRQVCQRFASVRDMDEQHCTIEEREEYEPHIAMGNLVFAGVDYEQILARAEAEADVILWDGGNNDLPFFRPDLDVVVADPLRPGHELRYYPGETNLRMADIVVLNKMDSAEPEAIATVEANIRALNPKATLVRANSPVTVCDPAAVKGKRVLVIEDGPTVTHGEMRYGAGLVAARRLEAAEIVDPRPYAQGSIRGVFERYAHLTQVLPAMGYSDQQIAELSATVEAVPCDLVLIATPIDLGHLMTISKPSTRVTYELEEHDPTLLERAVVAVAARGGERLGQEGKAARAAG